MRRAFSVLDEVYRRVKRSSVLLYPHPAVYSLSYAVQEHACVQYSVYVYMFWQRS